MKHYCSIIYEGDTPKIVYSTNENSADASSQKSNNDSVTAEQLTNKCKELAEKLKQTLKFSNDGKTNELITNLKVTYDIHYKQTDSSNGKFKFSNRYLMGLAIEEIIANIVIGDKNKNSKDNTEHCKDGTPVKDMVINGYNFQIKALQKKYIKNSMNDPIRQGVHAVIIAIYSFDTQTKQKVYLHQIQFFIDSNDNKLQDLRKEKKLGNTTKDNLDITKRNADIIIQEIKKFYNT